MSRKTMNEKNMLISDFEIACSKLFQVVLYVRIITLTIVAKLQKNRMNGYKNKENGNKLFMKMCFIIFNVCYVFSQTAETLTILPS